MDELTNTIQNDVLRCMLFVDSIMLIDENNVCQPNAGNVEKHLRECEYIRINKNKINTFSF